jgi:hypothetical protein
MKLHQTSWAVVLAAVAVQAGAVSACKERLARELPAYEQMSPSDFDFSDKGWRGLDANKCAPEAAEALRLYIEKHDAPYHVYFHAAQLNASIGRYELARGYLQRAFRPELAPDAEFKWNEYVDAVDAFLAGDLPRLKKARELVSPRLDVRGNAANIKVIDQLIDGFGRPYGDLF